MLISVKILKGGECDIEVSATASVNTVKEIVAQQLRIPVDQQRLVFKGKTLLDSESLCDYNIEEGNKLHLFVRESSPDESTSQADFYELLQKLLEKHFIPDDVEKVLEEFRKNLSDQLRHLSLDDIERIATSHLESCRGQQQSENTAMAS
ncbi:ubiquitin-like protein 4A [Parasteatoda tepidariorum]|uniref:Ubiquitin-like protein 4A n=1 Tax=Parasteatoda tepidariorum TaxID=114398 RepID=A0A2L2YDR0_PARTP|nr:ubiquitin-like protein 4A [Parasteatoda tepidariorum]